ncbi:nitrous oxide reductase accessory protein NosL [Marinobacter salicampi]|uniref:nitrous oxide reductase accessory protein NosL n=1 Tax=Marinobacter salicampi TaxID=435907 RepID=UPI00140E7B3E|nr:nitrous oxide reductase accessory protein NosL [Marinobacter salicampi]
MLRLCSVKFCVVALVTLLALIGCSGDEEQVVVKPEPVYFESGDECHVCGMVIERFPGPKGQAIQPDDKVVRKFCSTRDMFSWLLQPENVKRNHVLYVHDMAQTHWEAPDDTALVDAREAFFVVGSGLSGAMGPTLGAFADQADARAFADEHGGQVVAFEEITLEHLRMEP